MTKDQDIESMSRIELKTTIWKLRDAIRKYYNAKGNEACHIEKTKLAALVPGLVPEPLIDPYTLPKCVFLANCERHYDEESG